MSSSSRLSARQGYKDEAASRLLKLHFCFTFLESTAFLEVVREFKKVSANGYALC